MELALDEAEAAFLQDVLAGVEAAPVTSVGSTARSSQDVETRLPTVGPWAPSFGATPLVHPKHESPAMPASCPAYNSALLLRPAGAPLLANATGLGPAPVPSSASGHPDTFSSPLPTILQSTEQDALPAHPNRHQAPYHMRQQQQQQGTAAAVPATAQTAAHSSPPHPPPARLPSYSHSDAGSSTSAVSSTSSSTGRTSGGGGAVGSAATPAAKPRPNPAPSQAARAVSSSSSVSRRSSAVAPLASTATNTAGGSGSCSSSTAARMSVLCPGMRDRSISGRSNGAASIARRTSMKTMQTACLNPTPTTTSPAVVAVPTQPTSHCRPTSQPASRRARELLQDVQQLEARLQELLLTTTMPAAAATASPESQHPSCLGAGSGSGCMSHDRHDVAAVLAAAERLCRSYNGCAVAMMEAGRDEEARQQLDKAMLLAGPGGPLQGRPDKQRELQVLALNNLACYHRRLQQPAKALEHLQRAAGLETAAAAAAANAAASLDSGGDARNGEDVGDSTHGGASTCGSSSGASGLGAVHACVPGPTAATLLNMAACCSSLGQHGPALSYASQAVLAAARELQVSLASLEKLLLQGLPQAQLLEALPQLRRADPGVTSQLAMAYYNRAVEQEHLQQWHPAHASYQLAVNVSSRFAGRAAGVTLTMQQSAEAFRVRLRRLERQGKLPQARGGSTCTGAASSRAFTPCTSITSHTSSSPSRARCSSSGGGGAATSVNPGSTTQAPSSYGITASPSPSSGTSKSSPGSHQPQQQQPPQPQPALRPLRSASGSVTTSAASSPGGAVLRRPAGPLPALNRHSSMPADNRAPPPVMPHVAEHVNCIPRTQAGTLTAAVATAARGSQSVAAAAATVAAERTPARVATPAGSRGGAAPGPPPPHPPLEHGRAPSQGSATSLPATLQAQREPPAPAASLGLGKNAAMAVPGPQFSWSSGSNSSGSVGRWENLLVADSESAVTDAAPSSAAAGYDCREGPRAGDQGGEGEGLCGSGSLVAAVAAAAAAEAAAADLASAWEAEEDGDWVGAKGPRAREAAAQRRPQCGNGGGMVAHAASSARSTLVAPSLPLKAPVMPAVTGGDQDRSKAAAHGNSSNSSTTSSLRPAAAAPWNGGGRMLAPKRDGVAV
ncbi:hypothetical protein Agub_g8362 [Astrephomene gubernaculifera]|uniref:Uncharacterized protein n=1 Tax=Astrephomene gubernaculifera TaxID=47775 RepID=A0AAD3DRI7_9CHLO|nr:hypothetical protein Agub_g8362 [Astrephomene gubernaculifera]